jgi:hypothetical protein
MAVVGDVFGLNAVYDRQVENVDNNNFASWPEDSIYGYYGGGFAPGLTPANTALIDRIDFSTETTIVPGNNLPVGRYGLTATSSGSYGYFGGGAPPLLATIDRIDFSNETTSAPGHNLPQAKAGLSAVSNDSYGYFGGGYTPTVVSTVDRIDFSSETISTPGNNLSEARLYLGGTSSDSYGYYGGGNPQSSESNRIDRIDFSSETTSVPGNNLTQKRFGAAGTSNGSYGYFGGGGVPTTPARVSTVDRIDFSSETTSAPGNNLPQARQQSASTSNSLYGYYGGGFTAPGAGSRVTTVDRIDFSSETFSVPSNSLSEGRNALAAVSGGASILRGNGYKTYGYYGGGYRGSPSLYESRIERIDFSTQTDNIMPSRLIYQHSSCNTVSSNNHGYFVGGFVPNPTFPNQTSKVQRFDFISENIYEIPLQAPYEISAAGTLSNSQYGFIAGGLKGVPNGSAVVSSTIRLDFSSDSMSQPSSNLTESRSVLNGVSDLRNNLGYFGGGYSSCRVCRVDLSTETITQNPSPLDMDMSQSRSYQTGDYGYWAGGKYTPNQPPPGGRAWGSTRKVQFSTGTTQVGGPMYAGRYAGGVSQDNYYAWYAAGTAPAFVRTSNVQRVEFSTETYSDPGNPLAINRASTIGGLSN